ncbi:PLDc N-terminal domain-containing protein [Candidatus Viridilinea mediisalina]|uniref:Cardiolipin synthase N-terminal domain-containing protein n=1 Tax=Candidatus Viridilinea mediisalina TaxID=2024553 RepID=A0A2A6RJ36_9CHLR|nr:PLD nuclease N-terminal domain-containing protein [Candidatus Viridilinea mediisalina]PDW02895.1 hypothetical protein CJ255_11565 [Candidatus Viridilinea mediisalina]
MPQLRWSELTPSERRALLFVFSLQVSLLATALVDILRRAPEQVHGPRWAWALASLVSFVGPLSYFAFGRKNNVG